MSAVAKIKPFSMLDPRLDAAFDNLVRRTFAPVEAAAWMPAADVTRDGEDLLITLEIPGVRPGDVDIEIRDRVLLVHGTRSAAASAVDGQVLRREIRRGDFSRAFRLPGHVPADAVRASYTDGLLTVRVAGANPEGAPVRIPIEGLIDMAPEAVHGPQ